MKCKFEFKPVEKTFSDPVAAVFKPGIPFGREFSRGDIVLLHPEITSSKIFLNSNILRDAILDSKEYLEDVLNLVIMDKNEKPKAPKRAESKKTQKTVNVPDEMVGNIEGLALEDDPIPEKSIEDLTIE